MGLILELVSSGVEQPPSVTRKVFGAAGGTIGRAKHSDWVLPNNKVSSRHARISCENAVYYIEDTSTNGIFLNSLDNRLESGRLYPLHSGDRLIIEPYEVQVSFLTERDETILRPSSSGARRDSGDTFGNILSGGLPPATPASPAHGAPEPWSGGLFDPAPPSSAGHGTSEPWHSAPFDPAPAASPVADDPFDWLDPVTPPPSQPVRAEERLGEGSLFEAHFQPPPVVPPPAQTPTTPKPGAPPVQIPHDYNPLDPATGVVTVPPPATGPSETRPAAPHKKSPPPPPPPPRDQARPFEDPVAPPAPVPPPAPRSVPTTPHEQAADRPAETPGARSTPPGAADLATVLAAAGLKDVTVTPELAARFGEILRVVVAGVMDVLHSRHQVKDEFRMRMTYFRPVDNNPLKFSVNVDDALHNLLVKRNPAYLGPVEAFQDAFDDLRSHELAMLAGMRLAFESTLAEFEPDRLQAQFERQLKGAVFAVPAKLKYWDLFREHRQELARDPEATFRRLFGDAFTHAYEEQLKRLKDKPGRG